MSENKGKQKKKNPVSEKRLLIAVLLVLALCVGGVMGYVVNKKKFADSCASSLAGKQSDEDGIAYKAFSSDKADFTLEYPAEWTYKEVRDDNATGAFQWIFYADSQQSEENKVMKIGNLTETTGFFSGTGKLGGDTGAKIPYWVRTYPTNDAETFVTEENIDGENEHSGYIYWKKGKYFANADGLKESYDGTVRLISYYNSFLPAAQQSTQKDVEKGYKIAQHIAKSVKVK